ALAATRTSAAQPAADWQFTCWCPLRHMALPYATKQKGGEMTPPFCSIGQLPIGDSSLGVRRACTPDIYAGEQEQPDDVDKVPVPGGKFEAEMLFRSEVAGHRAQQTDDQEDRADDDMGSMETRGHEESGTVDISAEMECRVRVLVSLYAGEGEPQQDREDQAPFQALPVVLQQRMMRPGDGGAGRQKDQRVEQRQ